MDTSMYSRHADLEWAIKPNRFNLHFIGLWRVTSDCNTYNILLSNMRFGITVGAITLSCVLPGFFALGKVWGNILLMIDNLQFTLPITAAVIKLLVIWPKRKVLAIMNDMIITDWLKIKTNKERNIMKKWARSSRIISLTGTITILTALAALVVLPWLGYSIRITANIEDIDRRFALQSYYYYNVSKPSLFYYTYFIQISAIFMSAISYTGIDSYLALLVFHICAQLQNLSERLRNLNDSKNFRYTIGTCVKEHIRLLRSIEIVDNSFTLMLLVLLLYFGVLFCFYGFIVLTEVDGSDLPVGRTFFVTSSIVITLGHMFLFCVVGEILVMQCESIYITVHEYKWYTLEPKNARSLIFLMIQASKPRHINAGKVFPMTMATFCSLLKTSGGYISVLIANQN